MLQASLAEQSPLETIIIYSIFLVHGNMHVLCSPSFQINDFLSRFSRILRLLESPRVDSVNRNGCQLVDSETVTLESADPLAAVVGNAGALHEAGTHCADVHATSSGALRSIALSLQTH
jgi:hypothetical protein